MKLKATLQKRMTNRGGFINAVQQLWNLSASNTKGLFFMIPMLSLAGGLLDIGTLECIGKIVSFSTHIGSGGVDSFVDSRILWIIHISSFRDLCIAFGTIAILSSGVKIFIVHTNAKIGQIVGHLIAVSVIGSVLDSSIMRLNTTGKSEISSMAVSLPTRIVNGIVSPMVQLATSVVYSLAVAIGIIVASEWTVATLIAPILIVYIVIYRISRPTLSRIDRIMKREQAESFMLSEEIIDSIVELRIAGRKRKPYDRFSENDIQLRKAEARMVLLMSYPKYIVESLALVIIALFLVTNYGNSNLLSSIAVMLAGLIRLNQQVGQGYACFAAIKANRVLLDSTLNFIANSPRINAGQIQAKARSNPRNRKEDGLVSKIDTSKAYGLGKNVKIALEVSDLSFSFSKESGLLFEDLTFKVPAGSRVLVQGESGSGKTTLLRVLMGLYEASDSEGSIMYFDNLDISPSCMERKSNILVLHSLLSYVSQFPYISNDTIAANIAFLPDNENYIDEIRLVDAARTARIDKLVAGMPMLYNTTIGEKGQKLSGGQIQRVAFARSLYRRPRILMLDEYTSALDEENQNFLRSAIARYGSDCTVFEVSHRSVGLEGYTHILRHKEKSKWEFDRV